MGNAIISNDNNMPKKHHGIHCLTLKNKQLFIQVKKNSY